ncbi:MAG: SLAP domain-containing protein [Lactobacillus equicursoris]|uniref:SLAP domain-containing protein n=1 Tax=Lactobacillus equicursoris TaxID=420645 RepID=UPI00243266F5|nr:SLAP domain-containing protein [Lactobacillus equicursoris]MDD6407396.1 SLAP domain-containing protein [Lactobacillus equicursoris]
MKFTKKLAFASASLALTLATPVSLAASNAVSFAATKTTTQAAKIQVTKKNAPIYHKDGTKFTKKSPYVYGNYSSIKMGKGAQLKVIKTVTIKGAKYYYIGNSAYLKASDVKVIATEKVKTTTSTKKTTTKKTSSTKKAAKKTSSTTKTSSKSTTAKSTSSKSTKTTAQKTKTVTKVTVTKKIAYYYRKDGSKYTKKNPYIYQGENTHTAKGYTFNVSKTVKIKGATYYYIGNNAYLKASDVKVTATK